MNRTIFKSIGKTNQKQFIYISGNNSYLCTQLQWDKIQTFTRLVMEEVV